jgi:uncharacterized protein
MKDYNDIIARIMRYPRVIITVLIAFAILLGAQIPRLQLDASGDSLVLEGDRSLEIYRQISRQYGATDFLVVTYRPNDDLFAQATIDRVQKLKEELQTLVGVKSVVTYLDVPLLYSPKVSIANFSEGVHYLNDGRVNIDLARQEFLHSPLYKQLITSQSQTTTALQINLLPDDELRALRYQRDDLKAIKDKTADQKLALAELQKGYELARAERTALEKKLVADVRQILAGYGNHAQIFLGGVPMILADMLDYVRSDMLTFGSMIGIFVIITLFAIFRSPRWVILPLLACGLTCLYMLGGIAWFNVKLTVISANFVALLLIITLSIAIHIVVCFIEMEKKRPLLGQYELVVHTLRRMIKPCLFTTLTTMVAFMSLVMSGIRPVIDFGWMMTIAVGLAFVIGFSLIPASLLLMPRKLDVSEDKVSRNFTYGFASFTDKNGKLLMLITVAILVLGIIGMTRLKVENRFIDYFDDETEIYQGMLQIDAELGGTLPLEIIINRKVDAKSQAQAQPELPVAAETEAPEATAADEFDAMFAEDESEDFASDEAAPVISYWFTRAGMQDIKKVHDYIDGMEATGKVLSLATLYSVLNDIVGGTVDNIQLALIKQNSSGDINNQLVKPYLSEDGMQTRIVVRVKETNRSLNRNEMLENIDNFMTKEMGYGKDEYEITGMMVLYNNMLQSLFSSQIVTLGFVFVAIMLMFAVLFKSLTVSLIAIAPNVLAALFVLGGMGWAGIPLDMMTITIAAITVGIGVDDTIHYIHRFKKEYSYDKNYVAAMYRSHASIGLAMFYTSVVIIAGFSILTLSNFTPSIYFGLLTSVAMFAALLGALSLLPQLLILFKPFGK